MSEVSPPQSTACSPKRSVSVSSWKVVSRMPARVPRRILMDGEQHGDAAAARVLATHRVTGRLGRHEPDGYVRGRHDLLEMNTEPMGDGEVLARLQCGQDLALEDVGRELVGDENHDHLAPRGGLLHLYDAEPFLEGF